MSAFTPQQIERISKETFIESVDYHPILSSTNDYAIKLADGPIDGLPRLVLVDQQTAGRGRGSNQWWSSSGALLFSVVIDTAAFSLPSALWPKLSLAAGLAVCEAIDSILGGRFADLKWPNDVLVENKKICGILAEIPRHCNNLIVIGIGVNVNNRLDDAPRDLKSNAMSICEALEQPVSMPDVLLAILQQLSEKIVLVSQDPRALQQQWRSRCLLTGHTVHLELPDRCVMGKCLGIAQDGSLELQTVQGRQQCLSGVVLRWY